MHFFITHIGTLFLVSEKNKDALIFGAGKEKNLTELCLPQDGFGK
jgi:hypothetical protein